MDDHLDPWGAFVHDPRDPAHASLRSADRDRDAIAALLHTAYAEGRLDRGELDERTTQLTASKTLGELPPLVADLLPNRAAVVRAGSPLARATPSDLERMAREEYVSDRRRAVYGFLSTSLLCWVIWLVVTGGGDSFPWPAIVTVVTGLNVVRTNGAKDERIRSELRRLEKKQRRALKPPEQPMGNDD